MVRPKTATKGPDCMALSPRLEFRQAQSLTLTPQLMQSIRLLQLSHLELNDFVDTELLRNPLLEREDGSEPGETEPADVPERPVEISAYEDTVDRGERIQDADSIADGYDTAVENVFPDQGAQDQLNPQSRLDRNGASEAGEAPDIDQFVASRPLLSEHLEAQANMLLRTAADRLIARHLIDAEAVSDILSDDTIADMLKKEQGIDVARRTVAKYREGMNIPSSVIRRRQKKNFAAAG